MKIETALRKCDTATAEIKSMMKFAEHFGLSHAEVLTRRSIIKGRLDKAPHWVHSYLDGYYQALTDQLYNNSALIYGAIISGTFVSNHSNRDDYYEKMGYSALDFGALAPSTLGHYWAKSLKPYFVNTNTA